MQVYRFTDRGIRLPGAAPALFPSSLIKMLALLDGDPSGGFMK